MPDGMGRLCDSAMNILTQRGQRSGVAEGCGFGVN